MAELKPCPFCGSERILLRGIVWLNNYCITCPKCGAESGYKPTEQQAIDAWNKRS